MDDHYPGDDGRLHRVYIPTGIQHMTGARGARRTPARDTRSTDFDRAQRQQRVLLSLREQADIGARSSRSAVLVQALGARSIPTCRSTSCQLLELAVEMDTDIRSYVFSPPLYATQ